jgi:hypothetical protein
MYRVWEITPPAGYTGQGIVNSYSYQTDPKVGDIRRTDNLAFYPNSSWKQGDYINGWNFGSFINYPNSLKASLSWSKQNSSGDSLSGSIWNLVNTSSGLSISNITDCTGNCAGLDDKNPAVGEFRIEGNDSGFQGSWILTERTAPEGYILNTNQWNGTVDFWHTTVNFGAIVDLGSPILTWQKVNEDGSSHLSNSVWTLQNEDPAGATDSSLVQKSISDCTSTCSFGLYVDLDSRAGYFKIQTDIIDTDHSASQWYLKETTPPTGYALNPQVFSTTDVLNNGDNYDFGLICDDLENNPDNPVTFTWQKTDTHGILIGGSVYWLGNGDGSIPVTDWSGESRTCSQDGTVYCDLDPAAGKIKVMVVESVSRTWYIQEKTAPEGYIRSAGAHYTDSDVDLGDTYDFGVLKNMSQPRVVWSKVAAENTDGEGGAGRKFTLGGSTFVLSCTTIACGNNAALRVIDNGDNDLDKTNGNFEVVLPYANLTGQTWSLSEDVAPAGYQKSPNTFTFTAINNQTASVNSGEGIEDTPITPVLNLSKVSSADSTAILAGEEFTICKTTDSKTCASTPFVVTDYTGDSSYSGLDSNPDAGKITIANSGNLSAGNWLVQETKAPAGYELDSTPQVVNIASSGTITAPVAFSDSPSPYVVSWEKTDSNGNPLAGSIWKIQSPDHTSISYNISDCVTLGCPATGEGNGEFYRDINAAPGEFTVVVPWVVNGAHGTDAIWLYESTAPAGYILDGYGSEPYGAGVQRQVFPQGPGRAVWAESWKNAKYPVATWEKNDSVNSDVDLAGSIWTVSCDTIQPFCSALDPDEQSFDVSDFIGNSSPSWDLKKDTDPAVGKFAISLPAAGEWTISEKTEPFGYQNSVSPTAITVQNNDSESVNFSDDAILPTLAWAKTGDFENIQYFDETTGKNCVANYPKGKTCVQKTTAALGGATFSLVGEDGKEYTIVDNQGEPDYDASTMLDVDPRPGMFKMTNIVCVNGAVCSQNWTLKEKDSPAGYKLNTEDIRKVAIDTTSQIDESNNPFFNALATGTLKWTKTDSEGSLLDGSKWAIINSSLGLYRQFDVTDCKVGSGNSCPAVAALDNGNPTPIDVDPRPGYFEVINLCLDGWKLQEIEAPKGYSKVDLGQSKTVELEDPKSAVLGVGNGALVGEYGRIVNNKAVNPVEDCSNFDYAQNHKDECGADNKKPCKWDKKISADDSNCVKPEPKESCPDGMYYNKTDNVCEEIPPISPKDCSNSEYKSLYPDQCKDHVSDNPDKPGRIKLPATGITIFDYLLLLGILILGYKLIKIYNRP